MSVFQNGMPTRVMDDESDVEEEALVADYQEQVRYEDGMDELEQVTSLSIQQADDIQSRLAAAAQPLDFSASLEAKFMSYDNYCSLFHFILNSDGPVDLEPPSVRSFILIITKLLLTFVTSTSGLGMSLMNLFTSSITFVRTAIKLHARAPTQRKSSFSETIRIHGDATAFSMFSTPSFSDLRSMNNSRR
jgi:hypothetical protein